MGKDINNIKDNYVEIAKKIIKDGNYKVTINQIRNFLANINVIKNQIKYDDNINMTEKLNELIIQVVYQMGRFKEVRKFFNDANILKYLENIVSKENSKEYFILFSKYIEALVGYHKFYEKEVNDNGK